MCSLRNTTGPKIGSSYFKKKQNKQTDKREREREREREYLMCHSFQEISHLFFYFQNHLTSNDHHNN